MSVKKARSASKKAAERPVEVSEAQIAEAKALAGARDGFETLSHLLDTGMFGGCQALEIAQCQQFVDALLKQAEEQLAAHPAAAEID